MDSKPKRRTYLINRRFQIKWTIIITFIGTLSAGVFATPLWLSIDKQVSLLSESIQADGRQGDAAQEIFVQLLNQPDRTEKEKTKYEQQIKEISAQTKASQLEKKEIIHRTRQLRYFIILFVALIACSLVIWGIFLTHKVAGPLYVIQSHLERLSAEGRFQSRPLRSGDEFQDIYESICKNLKQVAGQSVEPAEKAPAATSK